MILGKIMTDEFMKAADNLSSDELGLVNIFISMMVEEPLQKIVNNLIELVPEENRGEARALIGGIMAGSHATSTRVLLKLGIASKEAMAQKMALICAKEPGIGSYLRLLDSMNESLKKTKKEVDDEESELS